MRHSGNCELNTLAALFPSNKMACTCGLERIAQEYAEMKDAMERVAAMRSNSGSFLAAQEIIMDALNKINGKG